jgi:mannose/cellobiose epimerase-like protein (N-acyl-D-glucosamine 2-epimerase family)
MKKIQWPDFSGHPPAPRLENEDFAEWIIKDWIPLCSERGEMTKEKLLADFMKNEGRMTSMPDFSWLQNRKKEQAEE